MKDGRHLLKVKLKSLAAEARIIKHATRKAPVALKNELANHRRLVVRPAARSTLLAYAFLRGRTLDQVEPKRGKHNPPNASEIARMVDKYGRRWEMGAEPYAIYDAEKKAEPARLKEWLNPVAVLA